MIVEGHITDESIKSKLYVDEFGLFREKKTNADRIRAMSDEELVKEFIDTMSDEMFFNCPVCKTKTESECFASNCEKCWVEWLKQEVDA